MRCERHKTREKPKVRQKEKQERSIPVKDQEKQKDDEKEDTGGRKSLDQSFLQQISLLKKDIEEVMDAKISSLLNPAVQDLPKSNPVLRPIPPATQTSPGMIPFGAASYPLLHQQPKTHQPMSHPLAMQNIPIWYHPQSMYQAPVPTVPTNMY